MSRVCVCSRWALTSARVTGSWSICSCRRFQPVNARSDVHPDLLGSVEVVIADDARSVHRSVAPASPPEALARIVVRPALAWRRDRKLKGEPAAENLVLLRFDQLEWRGVRRWPRASRRTGRARREHGACGSPGRRGTFWARGGPVFDYATGRHDFRSSLRSSPRLPSCADVSPHATPDVLVLGPIMLTTWAPCSAGGGNLCWPPWKSCWPPL